MTKWRITNIQLFFLLSRVLRQNDDYLSKVYSF